MEMKQTSKNVIGGWRIKCGVDVGWGLEVYGGQRMGCVRGDAAWARLHRVNCIPV